MTTIAFDGRYLAADTLGVRGGNRSEQPLCKIVVQDGYAFAFGGMWGHYRQQLMAWFALGVEGDCPAKDVEGVMLVVTPMRGLLVFTDQAPYPDPEAWPFAIGTGGDIALGAMGAGVTAMEAVKLAMRWDLKTGGEVDFIDTERLDKGVQRWDYEPRNTPLTEAVKPVCDTHGTPIRDYVKFGSHVELEPGTFVSKQHAREVMRGLREAQELRGVIGRAEMCAHGYVRLTCSQCRANAEANPYPV